MVWVEVQELSNGEGPPGEEIREISVLLSISACVFVLMLAGLRFISRRMIRPIQAIADAARRIGEGDLRERIAGDFANDEVGALVVAINRAFDRYHEAVNRLERFAGRAAHQLRTPLTAVRSLGEVCLQKERTPAEYRECIAGMLDVEREIAHTLEKLLMLARLNPSRVRQGFESVDVIKVASEVLELYRPSMEEKRLKPVADMDPGPCVMGDGTLLRQALGNVLSNAVQFTPPGGAIGMTVRATEGVVVVEVSDTGPGIPPDLRARLLASMTGDRGEMDTGSLGLALVAEIMRVHQGGVEIAERQGGGTCVRLRLPRGNRD